ncbi:hypothetical protein [Frondihabitans australicus]|uniref:Uncharacterized protein n=1 Tax=Frondihabitans australicus TaxID=386892 RepID=A0A495IFH4_9MICO|nr:hypothetical protein [Frondihabitans australicus]RKR74763.1 hypothetical protein C8E83_1892 [Frondihabitans australicus]
MSFTVSSIDDMPAFRTRLRWHRETLAHAPAAGTQLLRQRIWLGTPHDDSPGTFDPNLGQQLAVWCTYGAPDDFGQTVVMRLWAKLTLGPLAEPGTRVELYDKERSLALGHII